MISGRGSWFLRRKEFQTNTGVLSPGYRPWAPKGKQSMTHSFPLWRATLPGEADWAQEAALPARTGVGEGKGKEGGDSS